MTELLKYDTACRALAEARSADEVKHVRDAAMAMKLYARQARNKTLEADAFEIRLRAERRLGEMMEEQKRTVGLVQDVMAITKTMISRQTRGTPFRSTLRLKNLDRSGYVRRCSYHKTGVAFGSKLAKKG